MRIATWRWWELGVVWILGFVLVFALLQLAIARRFPRGFFWLIPYPHWRSVAGGLGAWLRRELPLAFYGFALVTITLLGITLYWATSHGG